MTSSAAPRTLPANPGFHLRDGEVYLETILTGLGDLCSTHRVPVSMVKTCWDHRITSDAFFGGPFELGEDWFTTWRHDDGTRCGTTAWTSCLPLPRCPRCGAHESVETSMEAYGDRSWCTAEGCGYTSWHSIGD